MTNLSPVTWKFLDLSKVLCPRNLPNTWQIGMVSHVRSLPVRFKIVIHEFGSVYHTGQHFAENIALNVLLSGLTEQELGSEGERTCWEKT